MSCSSSELDEIYWKGGHEAATSGNHFFEFGRSWFRGFLRSPFQVHLADQLITGSSSWSPDHDNRKGSSIKFLVLELYKRRKYLVAGCTASCRRRIDARRPCFPCPQPDRSRQRFFYVGRWWNGHYWKLIECYLFGTVSNSTKTLEFLTAYKFLAVYLPTIVHIPRGKVHWRRWPSLLVDL